MTEQEIKTKRLEILEDTIRYYSEDVNRRALNKNKDCCYITEDGKMCAIGRITKNVEKFRVRTCSVNPIFKELELELQLLGKDFLYELQSLHDLTIHWNNSGLSKNGIEKVEFIKLDFCV